jgi:hypothetical protein
MLVDFFLNSVTSQIYKMMIMFRLLMANALLLWSQHDGGKMNAKKLLDLRFVITLTEEHYRLLCDTL